MAVHVPKQDVLPFFERRQARTPSPEARIHAVLSGHGREFCGCLDRHPYELFLRLNQIEHRTTPALWPQSNGFAERVHRTLLAEQLRIQGRKKFYETLEEMQKDLEECLVRYKSQRPHQDLDIKGRTPAQAFRKGLPKDSKGGTKKAA